MPNWITSESAIQMQAPVFLLVAGPGTKRNNEAYWKIYVPAPLMVDSLRDHRRSRKAHRPARSTGPRFHTNCSNDRSAGPGNGWAKVSFDEASKNDFFLLGEVHGDNEIPKLLTTLWPVMWKEGYRHIAAELSPWAAHQLEFVPVGKGSDIMGLWTKRELSDVRTLLDQTRMSFGVAI